MAERILMIDDDDRLAGMVSDYLGGAGFRLTVAGTARDGEALLKRESFDAVILDLMLPDGDGLDLCRRLRGTTDVPILMLTARGEPMDRVIGLEVGADDYLAKPFEPRELQARLRAILRRKGRPTCCASAGWRSTRTPAPCASTARTSRSPGISSPCC
jgi:DNA-binding response OmpR family regulator